MKNTILLTILLAVIPCSAAIITVEPDGSGDVPTIQEAVDTAVVGDEIVLAIGTYTGGGNRNIDFGGKSITVRSTNPNDPNIVAATIIDCQGCPCEPHRGFSFISGEGADSIVSGLTVTNGYGPDEEISYYEMSVGGAIYCCISSPTVTNCTFTGNSAGGGGGMSNVGSNPRVTNCTFTDNSADRGGGMYNYNDSSPTVTNCTFTGNSAGYYGGGMDNDNNSYSSPTVTNCTFTGNSAGYVGGGMANSLSSPTVTNCTFVGNSAGYLGGGMANDFSSPTVTNCTFTDNSAGQRGGGMCNYYSSSPTLTNCTFTGNSAEEHGGGMYNWDYNSSPTVTNCILWANSPEQVYADGGSSPVITYSDIQGGWEGNGHSNIDIDPNFVDDGHWDDNGTPGNPWDDFWVDGDYHLSPDSPCIDTGDPNYILDPNNPTDLDGNPRIVNDIIDMGAYEVQLNDPIELLDMLADDVIDLNLRRGIENSLLAKIDAAIAKLEDDNPKNDRAAVRILRAFINAVKAQSGRKISGNADDLIAAAQQIIDMLIGEEVELGGADRSRTPNRRMIRRPTPTRKR